MFAEYRVDAITNGVHAATWTSPAFQALFDRHIPGWREDNFSLRYALGIPSTEVWQAHCAAKRELVQSVNRDTNAGLDVDVLTLGFARRTATYKRADLLFRDLDRLRTIVAKAGRLQIIYAGKAHPQDREGKQLIQRIFQARMRSRMTFGSATSPTTTWTSPGACWPEWTCGSIHPSRRWKPPAPAA
jgi:starch phosphorylase